MLRALAALHAVGLTDDELCAMGLKLGADVPYCLRGGTMLAEGIGEELPPARAHAALLGGAVQAAVCRIDQGCVPRDG